MIDREALLDLAAMRMMHAMPLEEARQKFSEIYGEIDAESLQQRRQRAIATFKKMFNTEEEPRSAKIWKDD